MADAQKSKKTEKKEQIEVRFATLNDFEKLSYVYERDGAKHSQPLSKFPLIDWVGNENILFPVAESKNKILGFMVIRLFENKAKVDKCSIIKTYSNKGIVKDMIDFLEPFITNYELMIYVPKSKSDQLKEFRSYGFKTHDEVQDLFGKNNNGILLKKPIIPKVRKVRIQKQQKAEDEIVKPRTEIVPETEAPEPESKEDLSPEIEEADTDKYYFM